MIRTGSRRGATLAIVGALVILVAIGVFSLNHVSRQQYLDAHRYTFGETALYLAESGLNVTREYLKESAVRPGTEIHALLLESTSEELERISLPIEAPFLKELAGMIGQGATIEASVEFRGFRTLHPADGMRGLLGDPREKVGELSLVSRATYRGVTRALIEARPVRVVSVVAPVLSKFTLFVRERGEETPNLLSYDRLDPSKGFRLDDGPARPVVLYHRRDQIPAVLDGKFYPLAEAVSGLVPDGAGMVYLGGRTPWFLHLVHGSGANAYEELFHLRRTRYLLPAELVPGAESEIGITFGFYGGILTSPKLGSARAPAGTYRRPPDAEEADDRTSGLHLFGDTRYVSPTVVLGPAYRSYLTVRLVDGLWFPYRSPAEFPGDSGPAGFPSYEAYSRAMLRIEDEAYNRSWDYIATNREQLQENATVQDGGTPFVPGPVLAEAGLQRVIPYPGRDWSFLYPDPKQGSIGACQIRRIEASGKPETLFRGALQDLDGTLLESFLRARETFEVPDEAAFHSRFRRHATLEVPGVVRIAKGGLELGEVNVGEGCMVIAEGDIVIKGRIVQDRPKNPLTLVSLRGDIRIQTGEKVDAHLVALEGRVSGQGRLALTGGIAAGSLDLRSLVRGEAAKTVTYNPDLDPTQHESYGANLRVVMDRDTRTYLQAH